MLFDRLGNRLSERCIVFDCCRGEMFVIELFSNVIKPLRGLRVDIILLDHHGDMGYCSRDSVFFSVSDRLKARRWELVREVDYAPF